MWARSAYIWALNLFGPGRAHFDAWRSSSFEARQYRDYGVRFLIGRNARHSGWELEGAVMASAAEQLARNLNFSTFSKAKELQKRILFTLGALLVYRLG